jgi:hypothetical protein
MLARAAAVTDGAVLDALAAKRRRSADWHGVIRHVGAGAAVIAAGTVVAQVVVVIVEPVWTLTARRRGR